MPPASYSLSRAGTSGSESLDKLLGAVSGTVSVWCGDISGRPSYTREADAPHYAASTMKLPLLVAAYRRHERGEVDLDRPVPVHNRFASALDGSPFALDQADDQDDATWARVGAEAPLRVLVRHAIVHSGNLATNLALEQVGVAEVAAVLSDAGCTPDTMLPRGIEDAAAREAGLDNLVTAADLARVMCGIAARTLAAEETCREVQAVLAAQEHRDKIPAGLPAGTYVANKTGWVTGVAHDVALVRPGDKDPYVLAVCTTTDLTEDEASRVVAAVSATMWQERVG
jgi:beta-lactamase class A